jgi:hypothetical protein
MGGGGDQPSGVAAFQGGGPVREAFGEVDAVGADLAGERGIGAGEEDEAAGSGEGAEATPLRDLAGRAEGAPDDAGAAREAGHDRSDVRRARGVGEEKQGRQGLAPGVSDA